MTQARSQLQEKDAELEELRRLGEEKEGEILEMREELDQKGESCRFVRIEFEAGAKVKHGCMGGKHRLFQRLCN